MRLLRLQPRLLLRNCYASSASSRSSPIQYDVIVVGGGSGGLAFAKTASSLGARVALVDAVSATPTGTSWGLGGTCANVGCIPKKLMHHAAIVGKEVGHASMYGWTDVKERGKHDWSTLVKVVSDRIKANNWIYRVQLNEKGIKYYNAFASLVDGNTVKTVAANKKKTELLLSSPSIVLSTGLRPRYPDIPGSQLGITSDDVFSLPSPPGRSLVVGGSYVALETAGLLADLGHEVDLLIRSRPLKGFDGDCVNKVMENLVKHKVNVIWNNEVSKVEKEENGQNKVFFQSSELPSKSYNTVIWAIGRDPRLTSLRLESVGVMTSSTSGRILVDEEDRTTTRHIYALGDVAEGRPELTPTAIRAGQLLARRLFGNSTQLMNYDKVATTVFTPLELGTVGKTEEDAVRDHGQHNIEVYHSYFTPFEFVIPQDEDSQQCYAKVICLRNEPREVLGIHIVGPNAAEIIQGYAVAFRKGITFDELTDTIAIHPCSSEEIVKLSVTKRSGEDPKVTGCCG